jgi:hypothetical protein
MCDARSAILPLPLLRLPGKTPFLRSLNAHGALVCAESVRTWMLKEALVCRLERRKGAHPLSVVKECSIALFAARMPGKGANRLVFQLNEGAVRGSDRKRISPFRRRPALLGGGRAACRLRTVLLCVLLMRPV